MKSYLYRAMGHDRYKVMRIDESLPEGTKGRYQEYLVDMQNYRCTCKGYTYGNICKHMKFISAQLKSGGGIIEFEKLGDYDKLFLSCKLKMEKTK
jgi:hypothetical protein